MAGPSHKRVHDPADVVRREMQRKRGILTQADVEQTRRAIARIGAVGETPQSFTGSFDNTGNWIQRGNGLIVFDDDGDVLRIGPTYDPTDPLADINAASFSFVREGVEGADSYLAGYDGSGFLIVKIPLSDSAEFWQGGADFKRIDGVVMASVNATTGAVEAVGKVHSVYRDDRWEAGFHADPGANTLSTVGMTAPATSGTLTNFAVSDGPGLTFTTGAVSGNIAQVISPANWQTRWGIDHVFRVRTGGDVSSIRLWVGLFSADPSGSATPAVEYAGFRYDSAVDSVWRCQTFDNVTSRTTVSSSVTPAINTTTTMRIVSTDGTSFDFYINNVLEATIGASLPATTTNLAAYLSVTTQTAATRSFRVHHFKSISR